MDKLRITGLDVSARIGIRAWERQVLQRLAIDLEFDVDAARTASNDDIADALDYGTVAREVVGFVQRSEYRLVESLAEAIAQSLLGAFPIGRVKVTVHKPGAIPGARDTSIEIQRAR